MLIVIICLIVTGIILNNFYRSGKAALAIFPSLNTVKVQYRDKLARGHLVKEFKTAAGKADKSLEIVVTENELWIRSMLLFAGVVKQYDLIHRIPLNKIRKVSR